MLVFVVLGLSFAVCENLAAYSGLEAAALLTRGVTAVPMHGCMGVVHGLAAEAMLRRRALWPLLVGYLVAAALHAFYDVTHLFLPDRWDAVGVHGVALALLLWAAVVWRRLPEFHGSPAAAAGAPESGP